MLNSKLDSLSKSSETKYLYYNISKDNENQTVEIRYEDENIWMTAEMIGKLYDITDINKINALINFIYNTSKYCRESTMHNYRVGDNEQTKFLEIDVVHYSPEIIMAVGFKIDSEKTIRFIKWLIQISTKYRIKNLKSHYNKNIEDLHRVDNEFKKRRMLAMNSIANSDSYSKIKFFDMNEKFLDNVDLIFCGEQFESIFKKCNINYEYQDLLQPVFESDRIEFYNKKNKDQLKYNIGIVVYLDTQIVSYLDQILKGNLKDYNILLPIFSFFQNDISLNTSIEPYLIENMLDSKEINEYVHRNIYSFYYFYYSFHQKYIGNIGNDLKNTCEKITKERYDDFYDYPVVFYNEENHYLSIYVDLIEIILLRFEDIPIKEKIMKLLAFYNEEHYVSDMCNLILAINYFERKSNLLFFSKIQKGMKDSLKIIKNMAWDLRHYYRIIHSFAECRKENSIIFPMIFSMDKRFNEIRILLRVNCVLVDREEEIVYPFYNMQKLNQYLSKAEQYNYLNLETAMQRNAKRSATTLRELTLKLENKVVDLLEK